jgi:dTDP-4-dehydrorhamnose 3,5-epimerase
MGKIIVTATPIDGLYIVEPLVYGDQRGYFTETYNQRDMIAAGLPMTFVQDNQSLSMKGVLRGLHYQKEHPQGKLVRVIKGCVFDVAVDIRKNSPSFLQWYGIELSEKNRKQFYISEGFAHGFLVLSDTAEFCYKATDYYYPEDEDGLPWNDPDIGIIWPGLIASGRDVAPGGTVSLSDGTKLIFSKRDLKWPNLREHDILE